MDSSKMMRLKDIKDDYCGISIGGNRIHEEQLRMYNNQVQIHALKLNMRYKFYNSLKTLGFRKTYLLMEIEEKYLNFDAQIIN